MKHKTKLFLTALMAVLLVMSFMPATAFAADVPYDIQIRNGSEMYSAVTSNPNDVLGDGKISYDATTNTLTLNNANLTCSDTNNAAIYVPNVSDKDLTLVLKGTNTINAAQCVYVHGNLTISGDGTLNATGTLWGIYVNGDLTIDDATVTASNSHQYNAGIHAEGSVTIENEATVDAGSTGGGCGFYSSSGNISINNSEVTATSANNVGMQAATVITITDSTVSASSKSNVAIMASGDITISKSEVTATTEDPGSYDENLGYLGWPAIWGNNVSISGGKVTATATGQGSNAINANSAITISDKAVVIAKAQNEHSYAALFGNGGISVSDSTVTAESGGDSSVFSKGTVTINNGSDIKTSGYYCGIQGNTGVIISGSKVNATSTNDAGIFSPKTVAIENSLDVTVSGKLVAVQGNEGITISGSKVNAASTPDQDKGFYSEETVTINNNSEVTVSSKNKAIQGDNGVTISGSTVNATSKNDSSINSINGSVTIQSCPNVTASGYTDAIHGYKDITISGSTVNATSKNDSSINSINGSVTIDEGSDVTASASKSGVYGTKNITISGSKVDVTSNNHLGIYSCATLTIEKDSDVTASGKNQAIQGNVDVNISESKVEATSTNSIAIYANLSSNMTITDSVVKAQAGEGKKGILAEGTTSVSGSWITTSGNESLEGITTSVLINGTEGKVIGNATVPGDVTIPAETTLTFPEDTSLTIPEGVTLTNNGTVVGADNKVTREGTVVCTNHAGGTATCAAKAACALCGEGYGDLGAHISENVEHVAAKAATCTAEGNIEYWHCTTCNKYSSDNSFATEITEAATKTAKINHTWDEGTITTQPTYDATGVKTYTCTATGCGATKTEDIPKKERPSGPSGPSAPATPTDNVTNSGTAGTDSATTTADINTTVSGAAASATVDKTTADKIVDKAVTNKSAEVVVDATTTTGKSDNTTVTLPKDTVQKIAEKTQAEVTVKTDAAEVTMDQKTIEAVATKATGSDVKIVVEKTKDETKEMEFELKVVSGGVVIGEFDGGNVKVTVKLNAALASLKNSELTCVHIDDKGKYSKVKGTKNNDGTYTFITTHFSSYAIMAEEEADAVIGAQVDKLLKGLDDIDLVARSVRTPKGNVKVTLKVDKDGKALIDEIKEAGYTVKYHFYRSTKKGSGYVSKLMKGTKTYTNTYGKKGTRYYYKARVQVYDANGKLIAKTSLKDCKYASRLWKK